MAKYKRGDIVYICVGFGSIEKIKIKCVREKFENGKLKDLRYDAYNCSCGIMENELFDSEELARQYIIDNITVIDKSIIHDKIEEEAKNYV
jgi:hypothetical protein